MSPGRSPGLEVRQSLFTASPSGCFVHQRSGGLGAGHHTGERISLNTVAGAAADSHRIPVFRSVIAHTHTGRTVSIGAFAIPPQPSRRGRSARFVNILMDVRGFRLYTAVLGLLATVLVGSSFLLPRADAQQPTNSSYPEPSVDRPSVNPPPARELPGADEVSAMAQAYPDRIDAVAAREGQWALLMDGEWYYWADGRLLPQEFLAQAQEFVSIRFYRYNLGPVRPREIDPELERRLIARTLSQAEGGTDTRVRFNSFLDTLYQISSREQAETRVQPVSFLGFRTRVHPLLVEPLRRVELEIQEIGTTDQIVSAFVAGLSAVHGYNWRNIAGTLRRSYHSYGVAVDLIPGSYQGQWPYWLWAAQGGVDDWWNLPLEDRWQIPQPVVDAFERNGFIWGGKWLSFDNLHFEYRPESIMMAQTLVSSDANSDTQER